MEPYQKKIASKHKKMKFRILGRGKNRYKVKGFEPNELLASTSEY